MSTKERLLSLFEENKGLYISGEEIAEKLSVSRTSVWKAVNRLRRDGYKIDAIQNKGYSLSINTDILSVQGIKKYLNSTCNNMKLNVLSKVKSTNTFLREKASNEEEYVVVANAQTEGRGRFGREFYSPSDTGIYMSLLLRPKGVDSNQAIKITTMAAVAACEAIEKVSDENPEIKWVNDVYIKGKKVCGILTEASLSIENGTLDYIILGIGINVYQPIDGFPKELENIAGSIFSKRQKDGKNRLCAEFLNFFMNYYKEIKKTDYTKKYREKSLVIGKEISILSLNEKKKAFAMDIDEDCYLIVRYEDGTIERLFSGEISIRLSKN